MGASSSYESNKKMELIEELSRRNKLSIQRSLAAAKRSSELADYQIQLNNQIADNALDNIDRDYILSHQRYLGYNINPYVLSRPQLCYWSDRIKNELNYKYSNY